MQIYSNVNLHKYEFTPTMAKPRAHTSRTYSVKYILSADLKIHALSFQHNVGETLQPAEMQTMRF